AEYLGVGRNTAYRLINNGTLFSPHNN
ncbi:MAG: helix-turn-helix domain-containing protein, partial [Actinobacteria bacterium]|nr:helix-turn-helix domain-containing protein [Actinomycetota bacterium]